MEYLLDFFSPFSSSLHNIFCIAELCHLWYVIGRSAADLQWLNILILPGGIWLNKIKE